MLKGTTSATRECMWSCFFSWSICSCFTVVSQVWLIYIWSRAFQDWMSWKPCVGLLFFHRFWFCLCLGYGPWSLCACVSSFFSSVPHFVFIPVSVYICILFCFGLGNILHNSIIILILVPLFLLCLVYFLVCCVVFPCWYWLRWLNLSSSFYTTIDYWFYWLQTTA